MALILRPAVPYLGPQSPSCGKRFRGFAAPFPAGDHGCGAGFDRLPPWGPHNQGWTSTSTPSLEEPLDDHQPTRAWGEGEGCS